MTPEGRIVFELFIGVPCLLLILIRAWILTRWKICTFSGSVTNASLIIAALSVMGSNCCNIWSMVKIIQYRNKPGIIHEPSTGLPLHLVPVALKMAFTLKVFYVTTIYGVKAAFIGIFLEIKEHLRKWLQRWLDFAIIFTIVAFTLNLGLVVFWCIPFDRNWTMNRHYLCSSMRSMSVVSIGTASNILTDLVIMLIPCFVMKTFPLRRREWYGIAFVFFLGVVCIAAAFVRFVYLYKFITVGDKNGQLPSQQNVIAISSEVEACIAVWAACLPALRAVISRRSSRINTPTPRALPCGGTPASVGEAVVAVRCSRVFEQALSPPENAVLAKGLGYGIYEPPKGIEGSQAGDCQRMESTREWQLQDCGMYDIERMDSDQDGSDIDLRDSVGEPPG